MGTVEAFILGMLVGMVIVMIGVVWAIRDGMR